MQAQSFVILKNGDQIPYGKFRVKNKEASIEIKKPNKTVLPIDEIRYLVTKEGELRYLKPTRQANTINGPEYRVMEKIMDGAISIYSYTQNFSVGSGQYANNYSITYYFAENAASFNEVFNSQLLESSNKTNKEIFSAYFANDQKILNELNSEGFRANTKNVLDLVRRYNLNNYDQFNSASTSVVAEVVLIRNQQRSENETVSVAVAGQTMTLRNMDMRMLKLRTAALNKLCFSANENEHCEIIQPSEHIVNYLEVKVKNDGTFSVEPLGITRFQRNLQIIRTADIQPAL